MRRVFDRCSWLLVVAVCVWTSCGGGGGFRTLTESDVTGIQSGDAQGTSWSGTYRITVSVTARECDQINIVSYPTTADVSQTDGRLVVDLSYASVTHFSGAIYSDGRFVIGGLTTHSGGVVEYALVEGQVSGSGVDGDLYLTFALPDGSTCRGAGNVSGARE